MELLAYLGYIVAAILALGMLMGLFILSKAYKDKRKVKSVELAPWKVKVEFQEENNNV